MQLEWNRFLTGIALFKQNQGLVWICCLAVFVVLFKRGMLKENAFWVTSALLSGVVLFPASAIVLLKVYTPYFNWLDLQVLFPTTILMGYLGVILFDDLKARCIPGLKWNKNKNSLLAAMSVVVLFAVATSFHSVDVRIKPDKNGVPVQTAEVFAAVEAYVTEESFVLAAPSEILTYTRLYNASWRPLYGRDLWDQKAASYIQSGYTTEYQYYEFLEQIELELEVREDFIVLVESGTADCVIVPAHWSVWLEDVEGYEVAPLTDSFVGIIKKDLLTK